LKKLRFFLAAVTLFWQGFALADTTDIFVRLTANPFSPPYYLFSYTENGDPVTLELIRGNTYTFTRTDSDSDHPFNIGSGWRAADPDLIVSSTGTRNTVGGVASIQRGQTLTVTIPSDFVRDTITYFCFPHSTMVGQIAIAADLSDSAEPPFSGTIFIDPDIITDKDPSTYLSQSFGGQAERTMYDRREGFITNTAFLFNADYSDGLTIEIQVNSEFGTQEAAGVQSEKYAPFIGQLPKALRRDVETVWIHKGTEPFGGGNNNLLIHVGQGEQYIENGILEETLVHEAAHTSLDSYYADSAGWKAAQEADGIFISTYARDYPEREDIAESFLPYLAIRYKSDRISSELYTTITETIPNRIEYFDGLDLDLRLLIDADNDGVADYEDGFPTDPTESKDTDGDGTGDNADAFPNDASETLDTDSDGIGNNADTDDDGDGFSDDQEVIDGTDQLSQYSCKSGCFSFDIDQSASLNALTDGLLVMRHLFDFSGDTLVANATDTSASRSAAIDITGYLTDGREELDIDGSGDVEALTDGLLLIRYLFDFRGESLIKNAVDTNGTRTTAADIEAYIEARIPQ
jgi:hypothetical protein